MYSNSTHFLIRNSCIGNLHWEWDGQIAKKRSVLDKIFSFRDFMSDFCEIVIFRLLFEARKISIFKTRHVVFHFETRDLENQNI